MMVLERFQLDQILLFPHSRVTRKVRQTQHQNPEFGHTQVRLKKKPAKKYISIEGGRG